MASWEEGETRAVWPSREEGKARAVWPNREEGETRNLSSPSTV